MGPRQRHLRRLARPIGRLFACDEATLDDIEALKDREA
jgi:hypothetical protein